MNREEKNYLTSEILNNGFVYKEQAMSKKGEKQTSYVKNELSPLTSISF